VHGRTRNNYIFLEHCVGVVNKRAPAIIYSQAVKIYQRRRASRKRQPTCYSSVLF